MDVQHVGLTILRAELDQEAIEETIAAVGSR